MEQPNRKEETTTMCEGEKKDVCLMQTSPVQNEASSIQNEGSVCLGKFKDVSSLLDAYNALQAEFTRKSQKLAELSKLQTENKCVQNISKNDENFEKINQNEAQKESGLGQKEVLLQQTNTEDASENKPQLDAKLFDAQVKKFFVTHDDAKVFAKQVSKILLENPSMQKLDNAVELAYKIAKSETKKTPEEFLKDENFLNQYVLGSEEVSKKVLQNILDKARVSAPKIISSPLGGACSKSVSVPQNLEDAKDFILKRILEK